jgi:hypothetical protein
MQDDNETICCDSNPAGVDGWSVKPRLRPARSRTPAPQALMPARVRAGSRWEMGSGGTMGWRRKGGGGEGKRQEVEI